MCLVGGLVRSVKEMGVKRQYRTGISNMNVEFESISQEDR